MKDKMHKQALSILRSILPWFSDSQSSVQSKYRTNYKGVRGRVGVVGGARDYAGAPYFASISAMRLGADLSYVICTRDASQVIKSYSPDLIVVPLLDHPDEDVFDKEIECLLTRLHALVIGPGLGREYMLHTRAKKILERAKLRSIPIIMDADGLILVTEDTKLIESYPRGLLTPNRIEFRRMLEKVLPSKVFDLQDRSSVDITPLVRECSQKLDTNILSKGLVDIVCSDTSQGQIKLTTDDSSGSNRRCGGQGDILSGLAAVYAHWIHQLNESVSSEEHKLKNQMAWAGYLAAITTRRSNELAFEKNRSGMLASDMIGMIPAALDSLLKESEPQVTSSSHNYKYEGCLNNDEITRYARQMMLGEFGPSRQLSLRRSSALIVGAGGLGCPSAAYLGAAGIGRLGLIDHDKVEASNLHRQILHSTDKIGMFKTKSVEQAVKAINPHVEVRTHSFKLDRSNAVEIVGQYDIILDCTDNLLTRYMISDACVIAKKPLISAAALRMDGQLTVYNYDEDTPCFRCLFPKPPPPNAVGSCSEDGVLGVVPGVMGVHQALEAIKIAAGIRPAYAGTMLLFDGQLGQFRHVKLSKRKHDCLACGDNSELKKDLLDYGKFCGENPCKNENKTNLLADSERVTVEEYSEVINSGKAHVLIDVRPKEQSNISRLRHALQLPLPWMVENPNETKSLIRNQLNVNQTNEIYVVCRKGIASQRGVRFIQDLMGEDDPQVVCKDVVGGMTTWAKRIDPDNFSCL